MTVNGLFTADANDDDAGDGNLNDFETLLRTLADDVCSAINKQSGS